MLMYASQIIKIATMASLGWHMQFGQDFFIPSFLRELYQLNS